MTGEEQKWVTFDCYGTLLDWQGGFRTILRSVAGDRTEELVDSYHDFEIAVEEGATIVRVGRALFGPRGPYRDAGGAPARLG